MQEISLTSLFPSSVAPTAVSAIRVRAVPRTFHFKQPAGTSRGVYTERRSWYVVITSVSDPRLLGLGECAPLPALSCDDLPDYGSRFRAFCARLERDGRLDLADLRPFPSILFGLETALLSARASLRGDYRQLFDTPFSRGEASIRINGLVWMGNFEEMAARMEEKLRAGFRCVKIKIGAIDFGQETELLRRLRRRFDRTQVELRVDANGAFSPAEAPEKLARLAEFDLHSIEQPIRAGQWEEMARLCRTSPLPVALDEELIGVHDPAEKRALLDAVRPQYLVLKPSLHGGLRGAEEWMAAARERGIGYWITSALESNVGLNALAQWTATLGGGVQDLTHGLGTGLLFTDNFRGTDLYVEGERLWAADRATRDFRAELRAFRAEWDGDGPTLEVHTSGSTGKPKNLRVEKRRMAASAAATCRFLRLRPGDTALLCMPLRFIAGKMMAVRAFTHRLRLLAVAPSAHPFAGLHFSPDFVALTPMQVYETLRVPRERALLRGVRRLLIGGGAIDADLLARLRDFPHEVWQTYGMTETLSHIALRRLNVPVPTGFSPLPGVEVGIGADGCLRIDAPAVCPETLFTHDRAEWLPDGTFRILGRTDNVVCSGGIKWQIEELEAVLARACREAGLRAPFLLTAVAHAKFGEALTLLTDRAEALPALRGLCSRVLTGYARPRYYLSVDRLPLTPTGKPARAEAREKARAALAGAQKAGTAP